MCRQLAVSRTGYCQWRERVPSPHARAQATLDARVAAIHADRQRRYGRPRILRELLAQGPPVGHERVRRSLNRQGLRPVYRRPYRVTTDSDHTLPVAPHVLDRRFTGWAPNQAWVGDITYAWTAEGWLYLACILDLASRRIVGWSMSDRIRVDLVCQALTSAYWQRKPKPGLIMHTDRGGQYASASHLNSTVTRNDQRAQKNPLRAFSHSLSPLQTLARITFELEMPATADVRILDIVNPAVDDSSVVFAASRSGLGAASYPRRAHEAFVKAGGTSES